MIRSARNHVTRFYLAVIFLLLSSMVVTAQSDGQPWNLWTGLDVRQLDDDHTGSMFAASEVNGVPVVMMTPGGTSVETKLAYPVSGEDLQAWRDSGHVRLDVYLPEANRLNPNAFFLGLGDVTGAWMWVGGWW